MLVVVALAEEAAHLPPDVDVVVCGVGKVAATAALARRLGAGPRPDLVVNLGTAGALAPHLDGVHEVGYVTQHDFPYDAIEALLRTPLPRGFSLSASAPPQPTPSAAPGSVTLASGDAFVNATRTAERLRAAGIDLVDMEAFGLAAVCAEAGVPFRCVKAVSDHADEQAGDSWLDLVDSCARGLADWVVQSRR